MPSARWSRTSRSCCGPRCRAGRAINFVEGGPVAKGAVLVELDSSVERAELAQAQAQQVLAPQQFRAGQGAAPQQCRARSARWTRPMRRCARPTRSVDLAQARLDKRKLVAPFDARAGLRTVSPGDFVTDDTEIVNLEQIDPLKVDFRVPELFLPAVAPGQRITLEIDAYPGQAFTRRGAGAQPAGRRRRPRGGRARRDRQRRGQAAAGPVRAGPADPGRAAERAVRARAGDPAAGRPGIRVQGRRSPATARASPS